MTTCICGHDLFSHGKSYERGYLSIVDDPLAGTFGVSPFTLTGPCSGKGSEGTACTCKRFQKSLAEDFKTWPTPVRFDPAYYRRGTMLGDYSCGFWACSLPRFHSGPHNYNDLKKYDRPQGPGRPEVH